MDDPDATLAAIREAVEDYGAAGNAAELLAAAEVIVTEFEQLDNWLTGSGPFPREWLRLREMIAGRPPSSAGRNGT